MKNNIDFYKHYANADQHPKFKMLRVEYGWAGEGMFWALNNRIAVSENCLLDINKKYIKSGVAADLGLSSDEFDRFIMFLLEDCELIFEKTQGIISTDIIQETLDIVVKKRFKNKSDYEKRIKSSLRSHQKDESKIQTSENIQSTSTSTKENILGQFKKSMPIPNNYSIQPEHIKYAFTKNISESDAKDQFEAFVLHFKSTGKLKKDWYATYQVWLRNALKFGNIKPQQKQRTIEEIMK